MVVLVVSLCTGMGAVPAGGDRVGFVATQGDGGGIFRWDDVGGGVFVDEGVRALGDALAAYDFVEGVEEDEAVHARGEIALVAQVVADALAEGEVVASEDLGKACDAGPYGHAPLLGVLGEGFHLFGYPGAGADEAHVSHDDVEDFREFVQ